VFRALAGYEDVNDADRLCRDPAMRWVVGDWAIEGAAASASQMSPLGDRVAGSAREFRRSCRSARPVDRRVHQRRPPRTIVLDMDSSESRTYGEQEGSAYKWPFRSTAITRCSCSNQLGDLERSALRPETSFG